MRKKGLLILFAVLAAIAAICTVFVLWQSGVIGGGNGNNGGNGNGGTGGGGKPSGEHTHSYVETVVEPTCTTKGYTLHKCSCGEEYKDNETEKVPHNYVDRVCTFCGDEILEEATGLEYFLRDEIYIVSGIGTETREKFIIPAAYEGYPVGKIGEKAFFNCSALKKIVIPDSVTEIGSSAFEGCSSLTNVTIGNGVTNVRKGAFSGCGSLTGINIPASVTEIEESVFNDCESLKGVYITDVAAWCNISFSINGTSNPLYYAHNLYLNDELVTDLVIPEGVTSIGSTAFGYCTSLTSVTIPDGVKRIGDSAFRYCSKLVSVIIGKDVTEISEWAFGNCGALESINIPNGVTRLERNVFCCCRSLTSINIPNSVETIGSEAFEYCYSLTSVIIPDSVTSIGSLAFNACFSLVSVTIPKSVTSIGWAAFNSCVKLVEVINNSDLDIENGSAGEYALNVKKGGTTDIVNKDGYLFYTYDNVNYLMGYVGSNTDLTLPSDYNGQDFETYDYTFVYNRTIKNVTIPKGVTRINYYAFFGCSSLTSITIPDTVTSIGEYAFWGCSSLTDITYNGTIEEWNNTEKEDYWKGYTGKFIVHCTDGDLTKEEA